MVQFAKKVLTEALSDDRLRQNPLVIFKQFANDAKPRPHNLSETAQFKTRHEFALEKNLWKISLFLRAENPFLLTKREATKKLLEILS